MPKKTSKPKQPAKAADDKAALGGLSLDAARAALRHEQRGAFGHRLLSETLDEQARGLEGMARQHPQLTEIANDVRTYALHADELERDLIAARARVEELEGEPDEDDPESLVSDIYAGFFGDDEFETTWKAVLDERKSKPFKAAEGWGSRLVNLSEDVLPAMRQDIAKTMGVLEKVSVADKLLDRAIVARDRVNEMREAILDLARAFNTGASGPLFGEKSGALVARAVKEADDNVPDRSLVLLAEVVRGMLARATIAQAALENLGAPKGVDIWQGIASLKDGRPAQGGAGSPQAAEVVRRMHDAALERCKAGESPFAVFATLGDEIAEELSR